MTGLYLSMNFEDSSVHSSSMCGCPSRCGRSKPSPMVVRVSRWPMAARYSSLDTQPTAPLVEHIGLCNDALISVGKPPLLRGAAGDWAAQSAQ